MPFHNREDFKDLKLFELLEEYWVLVEKYSDNGYSIYYFWLVNSKKWILEFLRNKWTRFLLPLDHFINRIEELHHYLPPPPYQYDPTLYIDSE